MRTNLSPMRSRLLGLMVITSALGGCAELTSIHHQRPFPVTPSASGGQSGTVGGQGSIVTVDAKQRHVIALPEWEGAATTPTRWRVCSEAAPDVFSALASSGALSLNLSKTPSGEGSFSISETAAVIQRTQTTNMLRESFFRTCERYASGAISRTQFIIQAARDQRSMVSVLAIEQLTGAVRPASTIISGPGSAAAVMSGAEAGALVKDYMKRRDDAQAKRDTANTAVEEASAKGGVCAEGDKKDDEKCTALKATLSGAEDELKKAQSGLNDTVKLAKDLTSSASASTAGGANSSAGISQSDISSANLAMVAQAVVEITKAASVDEPLMFCIGYLSDPKETALGTLNLPSAQKVADSCIGILEASQQKSNQFKATTLSFVTPTGGKFADIFQKYLDPSLPDSEKKRRMSLMRTAAQSMGIENSPANILRILVSGPDDLRGAIIGALRKIESDSEGQKALK